MRWLMRKSTTAIIFWAGVIGLSVIVLLLGAMIIANKPWQQTPRNEAFTDFMNQVDQGTVSNVKIYEKDQTIDVEIENGKKYKTAFPPNFDLKKLLAGKVKTIDFVENFDLASQIAGRMSSVVGVMGGAGDLITAIGASARGQLGKVASMYDLACQNNAALPALP